MTRGGALLQGWLALTALGAAYFVSQRPTTRPIGDVKVLDIGRKSLERVRYENGKAWVEVARDELQGEPAAVLRVSGRTLPSPPTVDGGISALPRVLPERQLRGSKAAVDLLDRFAPLYATRVLGTLNPAKLKELGLDAPSKKVTVATDQGNQLFEVSTAASVAAPYLRRQSDGQVFLMGGTTISDLDSAVEGALPGGRLVEHQLHTFHLEPDDVVVLEAGGKSRTYVALAGDVPQTVKLATKESPATPDAFAKNWHDKAWRLVPQEILGKGENPPAGAPHPEFKIIYLRGRRELGYLQLAPMGRDVYAQSERTLGWVKLPPSGEESLLEGEKIIRGM